MSLLYLLYFLDTQHVSGINMSIFRSYLGGVPALNLPFTTSSGIDSFYVIRTLHFLIFNTLTNKSTQSNTINKYHIIKLMASIVCCMFRHLGTIFRGSIKTRTYSPTHQSSLACWTVFLCFNRLPQDATPVPKYVAVGTTNRKFRICILLSASACRYIE